MIPGQAPESAYFWIPAKTVPEYWIWNPARHSGEGRKKA